MSHGLRQGVRFTEPQLQRIIALLTTTDMPIPQIAKRMQCSRSAVISINRKYAIRDYAGRRQSWTQLKT